MELAGSCLTPTSGIQRLTTTHTSRTVHSFGVGREAAWAVDAVRAQVRSSSLSQS
jgi:hypothetical protein